MVSQQLHRSRGVKVLKAVSSPLRLQILNLLFDKSALSYTELMSQLKMNPSRDAGRFSYHLKYLLKANLVEADVEAKKYYLTDLGKMVLDVADRVEKKAVKPRGMLVRTSHFTMEEFDANKIANSLIKEARVPAELAQKAAKEAEKRLVKSKTKYLTAALIREMVNGILVEKGYEEYRHKLTRVGMPIHEVTTLIEKKDITQNSTTVISSAGEAVLEEYTLLNIFPRDIADAHLSGAIHIDGLGSWILKPNEIMHDLRFFFQHGIKLANPLQLAIAPPCDFESALLLAFNVLLHSSKETDRVQTLNYFNVFLAPFARGIDVAQLKEHLRIFILCLNQYDEAALGLELSIPKLTAEKEAIGACGKAVGKYGDYAQESRLLASLIFDIFKEESSPKPLLNPRLVIKINSSALTDEASKELLLNAHQLATQFGTPYFALVTKKEGENTAFSASGARFSVDLTGDWEADTLRTGCLGSVTVNMPRIAQECANDKNKFSNLLHERFELAARASGIKWNVLKQVGKNSLPFLLQSGNGDMYFRLENCSRIVNLAGIREAIETFTNESINSPASSMFLTEVITNLTAFRQKVSRKHGKRLFPAILASPEASERLAQLDVERYGVVKVKFSGTREKPYYSTVQRYALKTDEPPTLQDAALETAQKLRTINQGGNLSIIELEMAEYKAEALMELTLRLVDNGAFEFFTYNRLISYCDNCGKNRFGELHKCPSCGSMSTLILFDRFQST